MKMEHITIHTARMDESVAFYTEIVGLKVIREIGGNSPMHIIFLANEEGETCVELIEDEDAKPLGEGLTIGFNVEDVDAYHKELKEIGLNPSPIIIPNPHVKFFFIKDPNGLGVQFI